MAVGATSGVGCEGAAGGGGGGVKLGAGCGMGAEGSLIGINRVFVSLGGDRLVD